MLHSAYRERLSRGKMLIISASTFASCWKKRMHLYCFSADATTICRANGRQKGAQYRREKKTSTIVCCSSTIGFSSLIVGFCVRNKPFRSLFLFFNNFWQTFELFRKAEQRKLHALASCIFEQFYIGIGCYFLTTMSVMTVNNNVA